MGNEALAASIKKIASLIRTGHGDEAYRLYKDLFSSSEFGDFKPEDQRQALKFMVLAKRSGATTPAMLDAYRAAAAPLTELVSQFGEASDHEMLGACHVVLGNLDSAAAIFREGLQIERSKNAGSDLCGSLMNRLSAI